MTAWTILTTLSSVVEEARRLAAGIFQQKKVVRHLTRAEQKKAEKIEGKVNIMMWVL